MVTRLIIPADPPSAAANTPSNGRAPSSNTNDNAPPRRPTTEAQREAARRNGAKSRGPKTAAGKGRSRGNAIKHGLLCTHLVPPWRANRDAVTLEELRDKLQQELAPSTTLEACLTETLAIDLLRLQRCMEAGEVVLDPRRGRSVGENLPTVEEADALREIRPEVAASIELVDQAIRDLEKHERFLCDDGEARQLAQLMVDQVKKDQAELASPDNAPYLDPDDPGHLDRLHDLYKLLGRSCPRSVEDTTRQLTANRKLTPRERERWLAILRRIQWQLRLRLEGLDDQLARYQVALEQGRGQLVDRLPRADLVARYETRYRRQIAQTVDLLKELGTFAINDKEDESCS